MRISARKKNLFLRVALVALAVYIAASLIGLQLELNEGEKTLAELSKQEQSLSAKIDLLQGLMIDTDERLEQSAREQGMCKPGESVYYVVPEAE
jgi:cell division protein FtsB